MKTRTISNKMITLYTLCALTFITLALCGYYYADRTGKIQRPAAMTQTFATDMTYYDLPRMSLAVGQGRDATRLRIDISLEIAKKDLPLLQGYQPRITDRLVDYLGGLQPDQVTRVKGLPWLRSEMLERVNAAGMPIPIHDLLLRQMIVM